MLKTVLDTNVFISSFWGGKPRQVIDLWKQGRVTLALSPPILDEYLEVFYRLELQEEAKELIAFLSSGFHSVFISKTPQLEIVEKDPNDNKFIECAVALEAPYIVSGDKALLEVGQYYQTKIVSPDEFLKHWNQG